MTELEALQKQLNDIREAIQKLTPGSHAYQRLGDEQAALEAQLAGSGAVAQGNDATSVGEDGISVGGNLDGTLIKGEKNQIFRNSTVILAGDGAQILIGEHAEAHNHKPDAQAAGNFALTSTSILTFLFTDIEGSTQLWEDHPEAMRLALARHDAILREAIESHKGRVFKTVGDAFYAAFPNARNALKAALAAQRALHAEPWGETVIKVRMGLHTGSVETRDNDYFGPPLNRVARLMAAGHGGQVLLSTACAELVRPNLPPGAELRDMGERRLKDLTRSEHIYQLLVPDLPANFPPLKTLDAFRTNLPAQLTSFIGRGKEIATVKQLVAKNRLTTLTGSGGAGKTRLSLQVASELLDSFPDGVWFVEFAPLTDPALVPQTVMTTLGLREENARTPQEILSDYLQQKQALLLLDNCEHLVEASAQLAEALLQACSHLRILVSSREALGIDGETAYRVPSLAIPDIRHLPPVEMLAQYEAVRLFIERAQTALTDFTATKENAPAIAQICSRLDGIPLAIELAAARVKMLKVEQIAERLDDRFRLLTGGSRTALPRQQTLRAMIDWSYDLLPESERVLLRRLSVFAGGWTLEAAEQVCSAKDEIRSQNAAREESSKNGFLQPSSFIIHPFDVLDSLSQLVNKSLVVVDENESTETRYHMLETVRQYAREKLFESGDGEKARDQHLRFFIQLAEKAEPEIRGANQLIWLDRLDADVDNLRAALEWAQERDRESFLRLASTLWRFWSLREHTSDTHWLPNALALTEDMQTVMRARALGRVVYTSKYYSDLEQPIAWAKEAESLSLALGDKPGLSLAYLMQSDLISDYTQQLALLDKALVLATEIGADWLTGIILSNRAYLLFNQNDPTAARTLFEQGLEKLQKSGDRRAIGFWLSRLAEIDLAQGNAVQAEKWFREAITQSQEIRDEANIPGYCWSIITAKILLEDYTAAQAFIEEERSFYQNSQKFNSTIQFHTAIVNIAQGNFDDDTIEHIEAELDSAKRTKNLYDMVELTCWLAYSLRRTGTFNDAGIKYCEALTLAQKNNNTVGICDCLQGLALLAIDLGQATTGIRLIGAWEMWRSATSIADFLPFMLREREAHLTTARAQLDEATFAEAQAAGRTMSMDEAIALAMEATHE